jgi:hypothetical protein
MYHLDISVTLPSNDETFDMVVDYTPYRRATRYQPEEGDEWEIVEGYPDCELSDEDWDAIRLAVYRATRE